MCMIDLIDERFRSQGVLGAGVTLISFVHGKGNDLQYLGFHYQLECFSLYLFTWKFHSSSWTYIAQVKQTSWTMACLD